MNLLSEDQISKIVKSYASQEYLDETDIEDAVKEALYLAVNFLWKEPSKGEFPDVGREIVFHMNGGFFGGIVEALGPEGGLCISSDVFGKRVFDIVNRWIYAPEKEE